MIRSSSFSHYTLEQAVNDAARRLVAANVDQDTAAGVVLAIVEALGNVARHATKPTDPLRFDLRLDIDDDTILIEVVDYGPGFDLRPTMMPDPLAESGRGIPLMRRFCDSVEYRRGGQRNRLIMRKRYQPAIRAAS